MLKTWTTPQHESGIVKSIDVEGLPEPVAKAIELVVRAFRVQLVPKAEPQVAAPKPTARELPRWPGKVIGSLRREDIYADVG